jgi:hypothetical protein
MSDSFFQPVSGFDLPRFAGVPTFMRRLEDYVRCLTARVQFRSSRRSCRQ